MKVLINFFCLTGLVTLGSSFLLVDAASAFSVTFSNGGFESNYDSWTTTGDASIQSTFQTISPTNPTNQALITNACHDCADDTNSSLLRNDDPGTTVSTFNYSDTNPVASTTGVPSLQTALNLDPDAFSIYVEEGSTVYNTFERTPKEGSGILSDTFTVSDSFTLSFNWNYLTNDGASGDLGDRDFSFVTIYSVDALGEPVNFYNNKDGYSQIDVLADSTGTTPTVTGNNFDTVSGYNTYTSEVLPAGDYRIGYGVVDVYDKERSSALLVDNLSFTEEVPWEFSPTLGLLAVGGMFGFRTILRRKNKKAHE
ncbi:MAG: hypothetical protein AAGE96_05515 [Cyanobacteria bacterium P01_G01_bin.19]